MLRDLHMVYTHHAVDVFPSGTYCIPSIFSLIIWKSAIMAIPFPSAWPRLCKVFSRKCLLSLHTLSLLTAAMLFLPGIYGMPRPLDRSFAGLVTKTDSGLYAKVFLIFVAELFDTSWWYTLLSSKMFWSQALHDHRITDYYLSLM